VLHQNKHRISMKILVPVVLLVIIAILGCALRYEVVQKNHEMVQKNRIGAETAKSWQEYVITQGLQNYKDLDHGDIDTVKENVMAATVVYAKYYQSKFGSGAGTKFAATLSESLALDNMNRANKWASSLTNSMK